MAVVNEAKGSFTNGHPIVRSGRGGRKPAEASPSLTTAPLRSRGQVPVRSNATDHLFTNEVALHRIDTPHRRGVFLNTYSKLAPDLLLLGLEAAMFGSTHLINEPSNTSPITSTTDAQPATNDHTSADPSIEHRQDELGFSFSELLVAVAIIGILSVIVIGEVQNAIAKARLSACLANMVTIRETVWANCDGGMDFPDSDRLWNGIFGGVGPRGFWYEIDNDDPNKGHGNDLDGFDEQNPGKAPRKGRNIYFVLACEHDHGRLADYVYLEDEGSPQIAMDGDKPPIWFKFYRKDH